MSIGYVIAGLVVGFAVGLTGVGGGSLMTPLLHLGFGIPLATAVGTDLLYAALTKASGVWTHARRRTVDWGIVRRLSTGSVPSAVATLVAIHMLDLHGRRFDAVISSTLSGALILTAVTLLLRGKLYRFVNHEERFPRLLAFHRRWRGALTVLVGVVLGVLVTLTSVGAGVIGTMMVLLLYPSLPAVSVVGTEIAHAVPLTLVAGLGHLELGTVQLSLLGSLLMGSLPGVYLGSRLGARVSDNVLRPVLASMLLFIGLRLVFAIV